MSTTIQPTNAEDLNDTVVDVAPEPSDGGLPDAATPEDVQEMEQSQKAYQDWLKKYQEALWYFHGGNTAQRAGGESSEFPNFQTIAGIRQQAVAGNITGRDYEQMTGRVNSGIGTGDKPTRDEFGNITGYSGHGMGGFTPQDKWDAQNKPTRLGLPDPNKNPGLQSTAIRVPFFGDTINPPSTTAINAPFGTSRTVSGQFGGGKSFTPASAYAY